MITVYQIKRPPDDANQDLEITPLSSMLLLLLLLLLLQEVWPDSLERLCQNDMMITKKWFKAFFQTVWLKKNNTCHYSTSLLHVQLIGALILMSTFLSSNSIWSTNTKGVGSPKIMPPIFWDVWPLPSPISPFFSK